MFSNGNAGFRENDINEQMRTIASQLTPDEMHLVAVFYGAGAATAQMWRDAEVASIQKKQPLSPRPAGSEVKKRLLVEVGREMRNAVAA